MNYKQRYTAFFILDSIIVLTAIFFCYWLLHPSLNIYANTLILISSFTLLISHHIAAHFFHLYDRIWSVASVRELLTIFYAVTISIVSASLVQLIVGHDIYFRLMAITWLLHIVMIGGSRFILRIAHDRTTVKPTGDLKSVLIVGAGKAGTILAKSMNTNPTPEYKPVAFVDDDLTLQSRPLASSAYITFMKYVRIQKRRLKLCRMSRMS